MSAIEIPFHERFSLDIAPTAERAHDSRLLQVWNALVCLADVAVVFCAFVAAYLIRFARPDDEAGALTLAAVVKIALAIGVATSFGLAQHGLYARDRVQASRGRTSALFSSLSIALVAVITLSYFVGEEHYSRLWFGVGWAVAGAGLVAWRWSEQALYVRARRAFAPAVRVVVVGANRAGAELATELGAQYEVIGFVDNGSDLEDAADLLPLLGAIADLERVVQSNGVDEIFVALPGDRQEQIGQVLSRGFRRRVQVRFLSDLGRMQLPYRVHFAHIGSRPVIGFALAAHITIVKRIVDLVLGGAVLAAFLPALAAIALAIKLESPGPVFYRQLRVGKDGRPFLMWKFRSMRRDADAQIAELRMRNEVIGPMFKIRNDPRVTRVGRHLRRYSLDELPQLLNVMSGEMSLVGPRPPLADEVHAYEEWELGRLRAVPGMTGLWQVSGRSQVPFHDMVRLDLHYIRNWSLGLDLEIMLRTIPAVLTNRGAY